jgi:hypothetical protein
MTSDNLLGDFVLGIGNLLVIYRAGTSLSPYISLDHCEDSICIPPVLEGFFQSKKQKFIHSRPEFAVTILAFSISFTTLWSAAFTQ